ncbi:hypothetical protein [Roseibium aggregatum]|uniref:Uncharacterized protein n=1 Tax=Roseibium aggregatum TaxID=187304 RepID=A0A0M6Y7Q4_9HYPH|nr:hypothetical protein [Roseibium aggregatum]CTQ45744.1 hypothetical protein LAL4801_04199 [Roseibium aggregatum]
MSNLPIPEDAAACIRQLSTWATRYADLVDILSGRGVLREETTEFMASVARADIRDAEALLARSSVN